jgi:hypothetical protein
VTIRSKILAGCLALTALTGFLGAVAVLAERELGAVAVLAERELGALALGIYDDAFMSVSYLRSAQVGFAKLAADRGTADPGAATQGQSQGRQTRCWTT